ncbi:MAG TPA: hypothetical protein VM186_06705 [Planctomycetota bacterium]|nr:hypothetical protein [Planctomycetota bacterium]
MSTKKKTPAWETVAVFAAILSLWPAVLRYWATNSETITPDTLPLAGTMHWESPLWDLLLVAALLVMAAIAVRRVRRLKSAQDDDSAHKPGGPIDPYNSMMGGGKK